MDISILEKRRYPKENKPFTVKHPGTLQCRQGTGNQHLKLYCTRSGSLCGILCKSRLGELFQEKPDQRVILDTRLWLSTFQFKENLCWCIFGDPGRKGTKGPACRNTSLPKYRASWGTRSLIPKKSCLVQGCRKDKDQSLWFHPPETPLMQGLASPWALYAGRPAHQGSGGCRWVGSAWGWWQCWGCQSPCPCLKPLLSPGACSWRHLSRRRCPPQWGGSHMWRRLSSCPPLSGFVKLQLPRGHRRWQWEPQAHLPLGYPEQRAVAQWVGC